MTHSRRCYRRDIPADSEHQEALRRLVLISDEQCRLAAGVEQAEPLRLDPLDEVVGVHLGPLALRLGDLPVDDGLPMPSAPWVHA